MRDVIYYVATTLDGFIARADGSLDGFPWDDEFGAYLVNNFPETFPVHLRGGETSRADNRCFDTVLMGRKTYEVGLNEGVNSPYPTLDQYVFSRTMDAAPHSAIRLVRHDAVETVRSLKRDAGKAIWVCGGAQLAGLLFSEDLIDRLVLKVNPVVFGSGIPLFSAQLDKPVLTFDDQKVFARGHMILQYRVR